MSLELAGILESSLSYIKNQQLSMEKSEIVFINHIHQTKGRASDDVLRELRDV